MCDINKIIKVCGDALGDVPESFDRFIGFNQPKKVFNKKGFIQILAEVIREKLK